MATVDKNFRIKNGLAVEGSVATVNGKDILTKDAGDSYIINLIGGTATSANTQNTVVKRDGNGDFAAGIITADIVGNLTGDVTGTVSSISNHNTDSLSEGQNNLYFSDFRAQEAVADVLGSGLGWGSEGAGNVIYVDTNFISTKQFATDEANSAYSNAQDYAELKASDAQGAAQSYAEGLVTQEASDRNAAISVAVSAEATDRSTAITNAISAEVSDRNDAINQAINTEVTNRNGAIATAKSEANSYTDGKVADLVDGAPALLNTLNELAAAIADNPNYATDVANLVAGKQDTLTAGSNIDITGSTISVTGLDTADVAEDSSRLYFTDTRAKNAVSAALGDGIEYVDGAFDVQVGTGLEIDVNNAVKINRTTVDAWYDAAGDAADAQAAAETTAQNALNDVLDGTTPFTDLNINDVAKQVAARTTSLGSVVVTAYQFNKSAFKSGKFLVKIDNGTHNEISEILVTLDSSNNVAITEYAIVGTNGTRGTITADVDGNHCRIRVNPVNDSTITVSGTVFKA